MGTWVRDLQGLNLQGIAHDDLIAQGMVGMEEGKIENAQQVRIPGGGVGGEGGSVLEWEGPTKLKLLAGTGIC